LFQRLGQLKEGVFGFAAKHVIEVRDRHHLVGKGGGVMAKRGELGLR
jgi:hypothetical protein